MAGAPRLQISSRWPAAFIVAGVVGAVATVGCGGRAASDDAPRWVATDIGPPGGGASLARLINERGEIVVAAGCVLASLPSGSGCPVTAPYREFLRRNEAFMRIGAGNATVAADLGSRGEVVGTTVNSGGAHRAFLWQNGRIRDLGTLGGTTAAASAIDARGDVVGTSTNAAGRDRGFLWHAGTMTEIPPLPGRAHSSASQIDETGTVLGDSWSDDPSSTYGRKDDSVFVWRDGRAVDLGAMTTSVLLRRGRVLGEVDWCFHPSIWAHGRKTPVNARRWDISCAEQLNDSGEVVGNYDGRPARGFIWRNGRVTRLRLPDAKRYGEYTFLLNNRGRLVITAAYPGSRRELQPARAYLLSGGRWLPLPTLGGRWSGAMALNDAGAIIGWSDTKSGERHAVLWTHR